jgi:tetratricopeptide (TPR) repeat protein
MTNCPRCGYQLRKPDWRCPECFYEFDRPLAENEAAPDAGMERSEMLSAQPAVENVRALEPYKYPKFIQWMCIAIVGVLVFSLIRLPPLYRAAALLQRAEVFLKQGRDRSAVEFYTKVLEITPRSKRARIGLAVSYFRSSDSADHEKAMDILQGMTFDKDEYQQLADAMPVDYQRFFTEVKK